MSGKKSDYGWRPDPVQQLAEDPFLSHAQELRNPIHAVLLALTSNLIYEMAYKLTWWQWLFFPLLSLRLYRLQVSIRKHAPPDAVQQKTLERTVLRLEFGKKTPPTHVISLVRQNIVRNRLPHWHIRQAFNSPALLHREGRLQVSAQSPLIYAVAVRAFWFFAALTVVLVVIHTIDGLVSPLIPLPFLQFYALFHASTAATLLSYQLGYQWQRGDQVMQRIWPASTVHVGA